MEATERINGKAYQTGTLYPVSPDLIPDKSPAKEASDMPPRKEEIQSKLVPILGIVVTILIFIIGGLFGYIATTSREKGYQEAQNQALKEQIIELKKELKEGLEYQRTQNEVIGKQYAEMKGRFDALENRRMR